MNLAHYIHYIITIFIIFGFLSNNYKLLKIHLIFNLIIIMHWISNNNKCILSEYDYNNDNTGYTNNIVKKIFGINIQNNELLSNISYLILIISSLISFIKIKKNKY